MVLSLVGTWPIQLSLKYEKEISIDVYCCEFLMLLVSNVKLQLLFSTSFSVSRDRRLFNLIKWFSDMKKMSLYNDNLVICNLHHELSAGIAPGERDATYIMN